MEDLESCGPSSSCYGSFQVSAPFSSSPFTLRQHLARVIHLWRRAVLEFLSRIFALSILWDWESIERSIVMKFLWYKDWTYLTITHQRSWIIPTLQTAGRWYTKVLSHLSKPLLVRAMNRDEKAELLNVIDYLLTVQNSYKCYFLVQMFKYHCPKSRPLTSPGYFCYGRGLSHLLCWSSGHTLLATSFRDNSRESSQILKHFSGCP